MHELMAAFQISSTCTSGYCQKRNGRARTVSWRGSDDRCNNIRVGRERVINGEGGTWTHRRVGRAARKSRQVLLRPLHDVGVGHLYPVQEPPAVVGAAIAIRAGGGAATTAGAGAAPVRAQEPNDRDEAEEAEHDAPHPGRPGRRACRGRGGSLPPRQQQRPPAAGRGGGDGAVPVEAALGVVVRAGVEEVVIGSGSGSGAAAAAGVVVRCVALDVVGLAPAVRAGAGGRGRGRGRAGGCRGRRRGGRGHGKPSCAGARAADWLNRALARTSGSANAAA